MPSAPTGIVTDGGDGGVGLVVVGAWVVVGDAVVVDVEGVLVGAPVTVVVEAGEVTDVAGSALVDVVEAGTGDEPHAAVKAMRTIPALDQRS